MRFRSLSALLCAFFLAFSLPTAAQADPHAALVGEWVVLDEDGSEMLVMTLAADGSLGMGFDGEDFVIGSWALVDGKLQLIDDSRPEETLLCDYVVDGEALLIHGEGECGEAPPFLRRS